MATRISTREWNSFADQSDYRIGKLAEALELSRRQLERILRREFGVSPLAWLSQKRLTKAADLLMTGKEVSKVASDLRYKQASHFCRLFKKFHGVTPSQYVAGKKKRQDVAIR